MPAESKPSHEELVESYLTAVLDAYRTGRSGLPTAMGHIKQALQYATTDDPRLDHHMRMWLDAVRPRPLP